MVGPLVGAWMKEQHDRACFVVNAAQIRAFESVAPMARESKIVEFIANPVLPGNHMLSVK
jgi:hypothetical protein